MLAYLSTLSILKNFETLQDVYDTLSFILAFEFPLNLQSRYNILSCHLGLPQFEISLDSYL